MAWNRKKAGPPKAPDVWLGALIEGGEYVPAHVATNREPVPPGAAPWGPRRLNSRALLIVLGVLATIAILYFPARLLQERSLRRSALAQARRSLDDGHPDQALVNIDAYLEAWPEDLLGLQFKGELVSKVATSPQQLLQGIQALDSLMRLDPDPPARQEDRKRLVEMSVRLGDAIRAGSERAHAGNDKFEARFRYANKIAEQRIKLGADDGEAHRLLATTLERLSTAGDAPAGAEAITEYQKALRRDPGDFASAERLAAMRMERRKDQAGADQILDNLVKARPRSVDARLARARHFLATGREDRAKADVEAASRLDAGNKGVRLMAASLAIRRGDAPSARRHLAAIVEENRADARLDVLLAQLEFLERRPDRAVEKIRAGLVRTSGTDRELTWRLAYWLIQLGRAGEARPLMAQFRRLVGRADHPMSRLLEGLMMEKSGRHASAIARLEPAREEIDGEWKGEVDAILGRCHEAVGDLEAAQADFARARDQSPSATGPRQALARLLLRVNPGRAVDELEEGLRASPNATSLLAELAMAQVARQLALPAEGRDWTAARAAVERGLRIKADDPALIRARAILLVASGRATEAATALEEATRGPARGVEEAWLARAQFLEGRGRVDEAILVLEQGSSPSGSGDKAMLRSARASLLARTGHGRAALGLLAVDVEKFAVPDRAMLAREKAGLLLALGDRRGAQLACDEWAGLAPEDPGPGLKLVEMSRKGGTAEELERGVELLRKVGGEDEPTALAAQAIAILLPDGDADQADGSRLDQAELLNQKLHDVAPKLPITSLVAALLFEQSSDFEEAISAYKSAIKGDTTGLALPRLVALLSKLKRPGELAKLKGNSAPSAPAIDRMAIAQSLGSGDKEQAETLLARLVEAQPDSLEYRADLARVLRDLGRPEQAEATLQDLVGRRPERPLAWLALLAMQLERGERASALSTIERLKVDYKGDRPGLLLTRCLWALGDRDAAAKACQRELERRPDDLAMLQVASEIEEATGRLDRGEALVARARKLDPKLPWARRRMALMLSGRPGRGRWSEALALVDPSATGSIDSPDDRMARAVVLERGPEPAHRVEAAGVLRSLADDLPASDPTGKKARIALTRLLLANGDPAGAALAIAPAAAESGSPDPSTLALAAEALALDGKAEEARRAFDRLAKLEPDSPRAISCRALVLKAEGDTEAAASALLEAAAASEKAPDGERLNVFYFDRLVRLGPEAAEAAERLGRKLAGLWPAQGSSLARLLASRDRPAEALDALGPVVDAGQAREPMQLIQGLQGLGKLDAEALAEKARVLATAAALAVPKDPSVLAMTTAVLRRQRRFDDEAALYRKLLAVDPSNVVARNNLAWVLGQDLGRPAEGLAEVDLVISQAGPMPQAVDTRGVILTKLGRLGEAIADLERATKVDPSAVHQIHLARAYARAGRADDRLRSLEAARLAAVNPNALEPEDRADLDEANRR